MDLVHKSWLPLFDQYNIDLDSIYDSEQPVYPPKELVFKAFEMPVEEIEVLLLGQDPYHGKGQAHGLSFSVPNGVLKPPSLQNICKELQNEFPERNYKFPSGNLLPWAKREKIFLLNASLTVLEGKPNSHSEYWTEFTDEIIKYISEQNPKCIFLLLGAFAKSKSEFIKDKKRIITGVHPSPLAAHKGFFGSGIFQKVEKLLGREINWET